MPDFLHERKDFTDLLSVVAAERGITPTLIEKDYWIMHCIWGLQLQSFQFELKGGTSLSKGFGIISRFSEDIDIRFEPPVQMEVKQGKNQTKPAHIESRRSFYDWLAAEIKIPTVEVQRDTQYDDEFCRNGGIRLIYPSKTEELDGVKPYVLLEVGFDDTTPNTPVDISSWAFDKAQASKVDVTDNRAKNVLCYNPEYTFAEKLQTISTKYRQFRDSGKMPSNFLRHYADVYCLLDIESVQQFLGTETYERRKEQRFRTGDERCIADNAAFLFGNPDEFKEFEKEYKGTAGLYYAGQPSLSDIAAKIKKHLARM